MLMSRCCALRQRTSRSHRRAGLQPKNSRESPSNLICFRMTKIRRAKTQADLMDIAPRAVVHLRAQNDRKRLGLIFGSGASKQLGYPDWSELVSRIASHPEVAATELIQKFRISAETPKAGDEN